MRNLAATIVLTLLTLLAVPVLLVCAIFGLRDAFLAYGTWMMAVGRSILGIDIETAGRGRLDRGTPYIFMANHQSFLDGPLLMTVLDRPARVIVKRFVFRVPVLGLGMRFAGYVPLDKEGAGAGRRSIARAARLIREKGYSFLVFPEGTRSWDGKALPLRRGGFFLALETGAAIVPVSIRGTHALMPRGDRFIRKGSVEIVFSEPIGVGGYTPETMPELMERVRTAISGPEG
jgi:1-acyl-sn-glycerol-3-phosphate acyltransferase